MKNIAFIAGYPVAIPAAAGEETWHSLPVSVPVLAKGKNVIRVKAEKGGFTFKSITFMRQ